MKKLSVATKLLAPAALLLLGLAGPALAQDNASASTVSKPRIEVSIGSQGNVKLVGTIAAISGTTLSVSSWGGVWSVDTTNAKLVRNHGGASNLAEFKVGDRVSVHGTASTSSLSITAKSIQNESIQAKNVNPTGTISNVTATTFTLSAKDGKTYSITTNANTKITLNKSTTTLAGLLTSVAVRVDGVINRNDNSIIASRVSQDTTMSRSGVVSNITTTGFTLTVGTSTALQVTTSSATVIKLNGNVATLANLTNGLRVNVAGTWLVKDSTILATKVSASTVIKLEAKKDKDDKKDKKVNLKTNFGLKLGQ